eukprot:scaffold29814_cov19-Tisochrysis_lutea.AAC.1
MVLDAAPSHYVADVVDHMRCVEQVRSILAHTAAPGALDECTSTQHTHMHLYSTLAVRGLHRADSA